VRFEHTQLQSAQTRVSAMEASRPAGEALASALPHDGLVHVFVLSDGLGVNGSDLVAGLSAALPEHVGITGGLAGDGPRFQRTLVGLDQPPAPGVVAVLGLYGERLRVGYGSLGGWDPFGVEWSITRSKGNVLYELDGQSALALYKQYLGEHAAGLPPPPTAVRSACAWRTRPPRSCAPSWRSVKRNKA
jgi:hypothetical protein